MLYDRSDKHLTAYDSYNAECVCKLIKSLEFAYISDEYSAANRLKFNTDNDLQKYFLWKQYLPWHTNGCSTAPVTYFRNNPIAQELKKENEYFADASNERLYIDLRQSHGYTDELEKPSRNDSKITISIETKAALARKMRLRDYTNGEYIYLLHDGSLSLKYKTYTLRSQYKELES